MTLGNGKMRDHASASNLMNASNLMADSKSLAVNLGGLIDDSMPVVNPLKLLERDLNENFTGDIGMLDSK